MQKLQAKGKYDFKKDHTYNMLGLSLPFWFYLYKVSKFYVFFLILTLSCFLQGTKIKAYPSKDILVLGCFFNRRLVKEENSRWAVAVPRHGHRVASRAVCPRAPKTCVQSPYQRLDIQID